MTGDAGTPLTAKWQIIELPRASKCPSGDFMSRGYPMNQL